MNELERLRVRDEVMQAMYWMHAEGIASSPRATELARFLAVPEATLVPYLESFADEGLLLREDDTSFRLSAEGERIGKRTFADEFADMTKPGHGDCDENCWCHDSPEAAASCLEERTARVQRG